MQRLADTVGAPVERPKVIETTALGAAFLAGLQAGLWPSLDALSATWSLDRAFRPAEAAPSRDRRYAGWKAAVQRVRSIFPAAGEELNSFAAIAARSLRI